MHFCVCLCVYAVDVLCILHVYCISLKVAIMLYCLHLFVCAYVYVCVRIEFYVLRDKANLDQLR